MCVGDAEGGMFSYIIDIVDNVYRIVKDCVYNTTGKGVGLLHIQRYTN